MANGFQQAGLALQGLSAGLGGRSIEFNKQLRQTREDERLNKERQTVLDTERRKTVFTDAAGGLDLAKKQNWQAVLNLANTRLELLQNNFPDVDNKDTLQIAQLAQAAAQGDTEAQKLLTDTLQNTVDVGIAQQILPKPAALERVKSAEITDGFIVEQRPDGTFKKTRVLERSEIGGDTGKFSAVTKIYADGTTVQAGPGGVTVVKGPDGQVVTGADRVATLQAALQSQVDVGKAGEQAKLDAAKADKLFGRIEGIQESVTLMDEAIIALDQGAESGVIMSRLPSVAAASQRLDAIQKTLGLNVVSNTTFGALSEGELDLALKTALPTDLNPVELRKWLVDKKAAQQKLATYLGDVAIFISQPGNSMAGWMEAQRALNSGPAPAAGGNGAGNTGAVFLGIE